MARLNKEALIDYTVAHKITLELPAATKCPDSLPFVLLRDTENKGLRLRITKIKGLDNKGKPRYGRNWQFEARVNGKLFTRSLGEWPDATTGEAQAEAQRLRNIITSGKDPRDVERQQEEEARQLQLEKQKAAEAARLAELAALEAQRLETLTVGEVWTDYIKQRRPFWGELHHRDHIDKSKAGGLPSGRRCGGKQLTKPGPLAALMPLPLKDLDQTTIETWAAKEGLTRPSSARLAWRLLTVFLTWCAEQQQYAALLPTKNPAKTKKAREALGKAGKKTDNLQKSQLAAWFVAVQQLQNPVISACLQMMLLTGARPGEVLALRWDDVNTQWKGISIRDKVEGTREIPATPFMLHLLAALPRQNEWVFSSNASASGRLSEPNNPHTRACKAAGLDGLTLNGLRRSFKSLTEWLEVPVGVVAQIQGHKPSATAEKHYTVRPLELLRLHHEKIEAWILEQAGVTFDAKAAPGALRVVAS